MLARTRWGKIIEHEDFPFDTERILASAGILQQRGLAPVGTVAAPAL